MHMSRSLASLMLAGLVAGSAVAAPASLPAYGADPQQTSVSGLSSGAFMAVQLQVAYSRSFIGAGVVAGGPYYCAANNVFLAGICMGQVPFFPPNPVLMANAAKGFSRARWIDPLSNLSKRRIYVFSGTDDTIVRQPAVDATVSFFQQMGVKGDKLKYVNQVPAGHAVITPGYGNDCAANAAPYINHCNVGSEGYDQAGALLQHIYGALNPRVDTPTGQIVSFDQRAYAAVATGMADTAYLYVPRSCTASDAHCKVHVAIHGCVQSSESVGDQFYADTGYNNWADSNHILVLYPQVNKSAIPSNPQGCWDWWGYTGGNYANKSSLQMRAIVAMVNRLAQHR
ncbi:extracellular catalytic domain type 2 short-chain-length polyhydroxyalkanoate depolymerase [Methylibium sp.]|uniref:extracellular catalytic domain type 2 short-chain-length polyhydroxyalkanoate depolymerase n=1 Tax=Methylibium sp. TaxID=2067992 RepID=UPI003D0EF59C